MVNERLWQLCQTVKIDYETSEKKITLSSATALWRPSQPCEAALVKNVAAGLFPFPDSLDAKTCLRLIVWMRMNKVPLKSAQRVAIEAFLQHRTLSRSDLAEVTGLSRAAITEVT